MDLEQIDCAVCICTYNRAQKLHRVLASMREQVLPSDLRWQLYLIDNNSQDSTREIAATFADALPLTYCFEPEQGLSAARNHALRLTSGAKHILFTDDDVIVDRWWLAAYIHAFEAFPEAGYFGGRILPFYPSGKPRWLHDESLALIDGLLVHFDLGPAERYFVLNDPTPFGASFALSRQCVDTVGDFRRDLGVKGGVPGRGEETDYLRRAQGHEFQGVYVGTALVQHETDPHRLTLRYFYRYGVQVGLAERALGRGIASGSRAQQASVLARGVVQLLKGRGDRFRQCVINAGIQEALLPKHSV